MPQVGPHWLAAQALPPHWRKFCLAEICGGATVSHGQLLAALCDKKAERAAARRTSQSIVVSARRDVRIAVRLGMHSATAT